MKNILVYPALQFCVREGANEGDELSIATDVSLDDIYMLQPLSRLQRLSIRISDAGLIVDPRTEIGNSSNAVFIDSRLIFISDVGETIEALTLVEVDENQLINNIFLMPLSEVNLGLKYQLIALDIETQAERFAQTGCVFFANGTRISIHDGSLRTIETLTAGDKVITRDGGMQEIQWIGHQTVRADSEFAPVIIKKRVLHNEADLILSPEHRLFIFQRQDQLGTGRAETLVRVRHLVNGKDVVRMDASFVDYYQILFDEHHIIYAEGIAAESMLFNHQTKDSIPSSSNIGLDLHEQMYPDFLEAPENLLRRSDAIERLRKATLSE